MSKRLDFGDEGVKWPTIISYTIPLILLHFQFQQENKNRSEANVFCFFFVSVKVHSDNKKCKMDKVEEKSFVSESVTLLVY